MNTAYSPSVSFSLSVLFFFCHSFPNSFLCHYICHSLFLSLLFLSSVPFHSFLSFCLSFCESIFLSLLLSLFGAILNQDFLKYTQVTYGEIGTEFIIYVYICLTLFSLTYIVWYVDNWWETVFKNQITSWSEIDFMPAKLEACTSQGIQRSLDTVNIWMEEELHCSLNHRK